MRTDPDPQKPMSARAALLWEAERLVSGERNLSYGEPTQNFTDIAAHWTLHLQHKLAPGERITAVDVGLMMVLLKITRSVANPKRDNFVDIAGYAACGWEAVEADAQR